MAETLNTRERLHEIIYETDTPAGKRFDVALLFAIIFSVIAVMLESVDSIREEYGFALRITEWVFTGVFGIEYILRLWVVNKPLKYAFSLMGLIDLLSLLPTLLGIFLTGGHSLMIIRILRLLRVFRVLKLARYVGAAQFMVDSLKASRAKILVFLGFVLSLAVITGTLMYIIEGGENGFNSIPRSIYWSIVTITTVGYGDIAPTTVIGQMLASMLMLLGYAIIAVPTGIVSVEFSKRSLNEVSSQACKECSKEGHDTDATNCKYCGAEL